MTTPFTWSWSRHRTLEVCERRYWLSYYGARGGWRARVGTQARVLYRMRRLVGRSQWVGLRVHEIVARGLERVREGRSLDVPTLVGDLARTARREIEDARRGLPELDPRRYTDFEVLYYEEDPGDAAWEGWVDELVVQAEAAFAHPILQRLVEVPERIVEVERLEPLMIGDVRTLVSLDVLVRDDRGGFVVVDWKTGANPDPQASADQVSLYALYVQRRYGASADRIEGVVATTRLGGFQRVRVGRDDLARLRETVRASADAMQARITGEGDAVDESSCAPLPAGAVPCATCPFRRACARE